MKRYKDVHLPEVLFEFYVSKKKYGPVRVVAIDPITGTEVSMIGAPGYGNEALKKLATRKLAYVIDKKQKLAKNSR